MSLVKDGDTVKVHYTGKLEDGTVFDSSDGRDPLELKVGAGNVIPGFEKGVMGMEVGGSKTITIPADDAYGERRDDLTVSVKRTEFPENITPEVGQQLQLKQPDGNMVNVMVTDVQEEQVTLDANHPLAGKTLIFDVEVVEVA
jgi:FKBP-type peptidyl-prolyl cis-trans isomerase 2